MEPLTVAVGGLAVAIIGHGVLWFFKTPRQQNDELADRVDMLENKHHGLELKHIETSTQLIVKMEQLRVELHELKETLRETTRNLVNGARRDRQARSAD